MPQVEIDGVKYIPARQTIANTHAIARGLLMEFWGSCRDTEELESLLNDDSICVLVNDGGQGVPIRQILDNVAKEAYDEMEK